MCQLVNRQGVKRQSISINAAISLLLNALRNTGFQLDLTLIVVFHGKIFIFFYKYIFQLTYYFTYIKSLYYFFLQKLLNIAIQTKLIENSNPNKNTFVWIVVFHKKNLLLHRKNAIIILPYKFIL